MQSTRKWQSTKDIAELRDVHKPVFIALSISNDYIKELSDHFLRSRVHKLDCSLVVRFREAMILCEPEHDLLEAKKVRSASREL